MPLSSKKKKLLYDFTDAIGNPDLLWQRYVQMRDKVFLLLQLEDSRRAIYESMESGSEEYKTLQWRLYKTNYWMNELVRVCALLRAEMKKTLDDKEREVNVGLKRLDNLNGWQKVSKALSHQESLLDELERIESFYDDMYVPFYYDDYDSGIGYHEEEIPLRKVCEFKALIQDITKIPADAIVNSAHTSLMAGSGVCGTIHKAAGKQLEAECLKLGGCKEGKAKHTSAYNLPATYVIHAVGPKYHMHPPEEARQLLISCYVAVLDIARNLGVRSIVFPAISCGVHGFPTRDAVSIACKTIVHYPDLNDLFDEITFAVSSQEIAAEYHRNLKCL